MADEAEFFRNKVMVNDIDPECLWKKVGDELVLCDDDQHITIVFKDNSDLFYRV